MNTTLAHVVAHFARGGIVAVTDDATRENEGDLIMAAEHASTASVAFFLRHTSGLLCTAITPARAEQLELELMVRHNTERQQTAFLVTVDYRPGTTTGISAADRAQTIAALADPAVTAHEFARPGHILPLQARAGGLLERRGHTEAAVDLAMLAGLHPAALLCELVTPDHTGMMRRPQIDRFAADHDIPLVTIDDLVNFRRHRLSNPAVSGEASIPTPYGTFQAKAYRSDGEGTEHLALIMGDPRRHAKPLVRVHSECLTGDLFGSQRCDCGEQLDAALHMIAQARCGVVIYLRNHEGRGIGLGNKLRAYRLQHEEGLDTLDANTQLGLPIDGRSYSTAAKILHELGVDTIRLLTNNPTKCHELAENGIDVRERIPLLAVPNDHNARYLQTKASRMGHLMGTTPGRQPGEARASM
jgi:3,4-dihydroxy 2-butanone 4-phosphate synthase/GTP cyclohydrolase II